MNFEVLSSSSNVPPERFINFTCNCCWQEKAQNFCITFLYIYLVLVTFLITFTGFYLYSKFKGTAGEISTGVS